MAIFYLALVVSNLAESAKRSRGGARYVYVV